MQIYDTPAAAFQAHPAQPGPRFPVIAHLPAGGIGFIGYALRSDNALMLAIRENIPVRRIELAPNIGPLGFVINQPDPKP